MTFVVHVHVFLLAIDLLMDPWAHGWVLVQFQYQMYHFTVVGKLLNQLLCHQHWRLIVCTTSLIV